MVNGILGSAISLRVNRVQSKRTVYDDKSQFTIGGKPLKFYDTKQASEKLQISIHTLRRYLNRGWVKAGRLPGGTIYRFTERQLEDVVSFMEEGGKHEEIDTAVGQCGSIR
jgi:hypothetical protein